MKKSLLAAAVSATFLAPGIASAAPKVYGKFNIALENQKDEIGIGFAGTDANGNANTAWRLYDNNNSSRLGVKGDEEVGLGDLKAIYKLEYGIDPDGTEGAPFSERNIYVGLKGGFGTVQFGKYDTPVKEIGAMVDQFNDTIGDFTNILRGETRQNNMIQYTSPEFGEMVEVMLAFTPGENRTSNDNTADRDTGPADTIYAGVSFTSPMFDAGLGYAKNETTNFRIDTAGNGGVNTAGVDILRATGLFKVVGLELGALYQVTDGIDQAGGAATGSQGGEKTLLASVGYTIEAFKLKGQYGTTKGDASGDKRNEIGVGVDYKLSKSMTASLYHVEYTHEDGAAAPAADLETTSNALALIYSF